MWTLRVILWVVLIVIGARGVIAIALNQKTPAKASGAAASGRSSQFPTGLAEAYAQQFASVYLNASQSGQAQRAQELAGFLPNGSAAQLGWNKAGSLSLQSDEVAGISVQDAHHAVVTLLARVNDQLIELGVPIYVGANGAMVVSGEPAWLGAPPRAVPRPAKAKPADASTEGTLNAWLPGFFQAYAAGKKPAIDKFLARGASVTGLGGALTFSSISSLYVPVGGNTRQITVGVVWQIPGQSGAAPAQLQVTYDMTVVSQNANWYVQSIQAATQPAGQKS